MAWLTCSSYRRGIVHEEREKSKGQWHFLPCVQRCEGSICQLYWNFTHPLSACPKPNPSSNVVLQRKMKTTPTVFSHPCEITAMTWYSLRPTKQRHRQLPISSVCQWLIPRKCEACALSKLDSPATQQNPILRCSPSGFYITTTAINKDPGLPG